MNAVIYTRVSSTGNRQSTERHVMVLTDYATNVRPLTTCIFQLIQVAVNQKGNDHLDSVVLGGRIYFGLRFLLVTI